MARFGDFDQYLQDDGNPLVSGKLYFFETGTTTAKTTYSDINNSIPNTHPVILTASGRQPNVFFDGVAKAILATSADVQIAVFDPVGETSTDFGDEWVPTKIYTAKDVVIGSDGIFYRSLVNGNQNNNPVNTAGSWALLYSVEWNAGITYAVGALVTLDNFQYQSLQSANLNQNPSTQTAYWVPLNFAWTATATYAIDQNAVGTDGILYTSLQNSNTGNVPASSAAYWVGTSAAAAASATASANSATASAASETAAATSETNAATSATNSANSATASASSATASASSATDSSNSATASANSATASATSETNAANSATSAGNSATAAATSETNAANSATAAASSASGSSGSATAAAASATAAASSETAAETAKTAAETAETNAETAETNAETAETNAETAETNAAGSATSAANSATASANSATAAAGDATAAAASLDEFTDIYLGAKATAPTVDNDGNPLATGALYFNTVSNTMFVYSGSSWAAAGSAVNGTAERQEYTATSGQTSFNATYDVGFVDIYLNGSKLIPTTDFAATNGATVVLTTGAATGDNVSIIAYGAFNVADVYTQAQSNARYTQISNNLSDLASAPTALTNLGLTATATELNYTDGVTSSIQTQLDAAGAGSVTSVSGTGTVSGLTLSGTVTGSGDLTLGGTLDNINLASGVTGTLPVASGGTGATSLTANNVLLGNGTSAPQAVAPSTSGNILTSDGTTWASTAPAAGGPTAGYWVLLQTVTGTAAATFDFTSFINSAYSQYRIEGLLDYGGGTSLDLGARIYNSGSLVTSAYSAATGGREGTTAWTNFNAASHMSLMGGSTPQYGDPVSLTLNLDMSPYAIGISGTTTGWRGSSYNRGTFFVGGSYVGSLTGIRIYMASGSGTRTGSLRVWGFKKS